MRFVTKSAAIVASLMLAVAPAQANLTDEQVEEIFVLSKEVCPAAMASEDAGDYVTKLFEEKGLEGSETILLLDFCIMYTEGLIQGAGGTSE